MGRAERRMMERRNRIEQKKEEKNKIVMTREELRQFREQIVNDTLEYNVEALFTCFALAQRELYGFGTKRISRTLQYVDDLMGDVLNDKTTVEELKKKLESETGISISCGK